MADEIILRYKFKKNKSIKIFGKEFVQKNKKK